jgi:hypothetical protein
MTKNDLATLREAFEGLLDDARNTNCGSYWIGKAPEALAILDRLQAQESREAEPVGYVAESTIRSLASHREIRATIRPDLHPDSLCGQISEGQTDIFSIPLYTSKQALSVPDALQSSKDEPRFTPCDHKLGGILQIQTGYQGGYDVAWCKLCGSITWASDGLIPRGMENLNQHADWANKNISAWSCAHEMKTGQRCKKWCGHQKTCTASLKVAAPSNPIKQSGEQG